MKSYRWYLHPIEVLKVLAGLIILLPAVIILYLHEALKASGRSLKSFYEKMVELNKLPTDIGKIESKTRRRTPW
ncbi:MAG: hypothetical protein NT136_01205 [Candidatus Moranbacteria bacterium]|nr:hypothetical protein [Candidatus Moranbacteria bacterium]